MEVSVVPEPRDVEDAQAPGGRGTPMNGNWMASGSDIDLGASPQTSTKVVAKLSSTRIAAPKALRRGGVNAILVTLAMTRASRFGMLSAIILVGALAWSAIRFYLMIDGENQVSEEAFRRLAESITRTIQTKVQQDLIYQDMIANVWAADPKISREHFRRLVMSEAYAPGLDTMTGISLIPRVSGALERAALEGDPDSERLRGECCSNATSAGAACSVVAATGLFCEASPTARYRITEFGAGGELVPANGTSPDYLARVGSEEYMVVDVIEPFETNSKVWGFNLLSSPARHSAWLSAMKTGKKTFTRRLNLVQSTDKEFGVLVWLPVFKSSSGGWTTALAGNVDGLTAVGSVNGVYRVQHLLTTALQSTYSEAQLSDTTIFLFDNADELGGRAQFLAAYGTGAVDSYSAYGDMSIDDLVAGGTFIEQRDLVIANSNAKWAAVVIANTRYLGKRRTNNPWVALVISVVMLVGGTLERWLGHPSLLVEYATSYDTTAGVSA